jgi:hypothetical protein
LKLKPGVDPEPLLVTLRRGVTVRGRLFGVDGKPVSQARMLSRLNITPWEHMVGGQTDVFDGRFELRGCDPQATYRVIFFDAIHQQGAVAEIAGKQAGGEPVIVRLAPCGRAKARLVSHDGQPLRNKRVKMDLIVTPGGANFQTKELLADALWISNLDWVHYRDGPRTDAEGCLSLPALIPGAVYRFDSPGRLDAVTKGYSVEAGKTVDWGTLTNLAVFD